MYKNHAKSPDSDLLKAKKDAIFRSVDSLSIGLIGMSRVISHTYTTPATSFLPLFIRLPPTNQKNPRQKEFFFSHPPLHPWNLPGPTPWGLYLFPSHIHNPIVIACEIPVTRFATYELKRILPTLTPLPPFCDLSCRYFETSKNFGCSYRENAYPFIFTAELLPIIPNVLPMIPNITNLK